MVVLRQGDGVSNSTADLSRAASEQRSKNIIPADDDAREPLLSPKYLAFRPGRLCIRVFPSVCTANARNNIFVPRTRAFRSDRDASADLITAVSLKDFTVEL